MRKPSVLLILCLVLVDSTPAYALRVVSNVTPEAWMRRVVSNFKKKTGKSDTRRRVSFTTKDWPATVTQFASLNVNEVPILGEPNLVAPRLSIVGIAKRGEILEVLEKQNQMFLVNPLGNGLNGSGLWFRIRTLDGKEGWIIAHSDSSSTVFATLLNRPSPVEPGQGLDGVLGQLFGFCLLVGVLVWLVRILRMGKIPISQSSNGRDSYASGGSNFKASASPQGSRAPQWPWPKEEIVIAPTNVYEHHWFYDKKVGHTETTFWGQEEIRKDRIFSSEKVGEIKRDWFGDPKEIVDNKGTKVGEIKRDWFGDDIIVDKDGRKIGDYKKD